MSETINLPPDAGRMIEGLRDTGYEFNTAVADIIDNSIAAEAEIVDIRITMDYRGEVRISIADNGIGMDKEQLVNAMKYGAQYREDPASLGKFGLGLKTASTAFCKRLSVLSRPDGSSPVLQATWDLDHVVRKGEWELLLPDPDREAEDVLNEVATDHSGTIVTWDMVDRLFGRDYQDPGGKFAQNALKRMTASLKEHVGMVYQRFLDHDDSRARNLQIIIDGELIKPWDPYCEKYSELVAEDTQQIEMPDGEVADFTVRAFVLPRREDFPDDESGKLAKISNDRQGIYIYREQRLIHDADWLGMYQKEPHGTLLRVEFSFGHDLDEAFRIDIKKSKITLNVTLLDWLKDEFLPPPRRAAEQRYRKGLKKKVTKKSVDVHDSSNASIRTKEEELDTADVRIIDNDTGDVEVTNREGKVRLKLRISSATREGQCFVEPTEGIDDGMLWEPCIIDGHKAVRINRGHPYYHKVYVPNFSSGVTVQGMDSLLWALCAAELGTVNEATKRHSGELRYEVSRLLRRLVDDLPEPDLESDDNNT